MYNVFDQAEKNEKIVKRMKILLIAAVVFFFMAVVELVIILTSPALRTASGTVLQTRTMDCMNCGKSAVNEITSTINSTTSAKVGSVKGYVCAIDQLTLVAYEGKKDNRPAELQEVIDALYSDIVEFDGVIQQNKSIMSAKAKLSDHFAKLEEILGEYDLIRY